MFGIDDNEAGSERLTCERDCLLFTACSAGVADKIRAARAADTGSLAKGGLYPEEIDGLDLNEGAAQADADAGIARYARNCPGPEDTTDVGCRSPLRDQMVVKTS